MGINRHGMAGIFLVSAISSAAWGEVPVFNIYGAPGLIELPEARQSADATLSATLGQFGPSRHTTLTFQITPRLQGSFRYTRIEGLEPVGWDRSNYYDRSFDLRYQLVEETEAWPALAIGLQDFIGTGLYESEYLVASKEVLPGLTLTGGLGWGRLGGDGPLGQTGDRPDSLLGEGGVPNYDRWFRGPVAGFGGLRYAPDGAPWSVSVEYSPDRYTEEEGDGVFDRAGPWNAAATYRFDNGTQLSAYTLHGGEIGAQVSFHLNARENPRPSGVETAPYPVAGRSEGWSDERASAELTTLLRQQKLLADGLSLDGDTATLRLVNPTYDAEAQAIGRTARAMTRTLPARIKTFRIVPIVNGVPASAITLQRDDLEALEYAPAAEMLRRATITEAPQILPPADPTARDPRFRWSLAPFMSLSFFDPESPLRADVGLRLRGDYALRPNIIASGSLLAKLAGNLDDIEREDESGLPRVRTDAKYYSREGNPAIGHLTLTGYARPGPDLYGRLTAGYLETMYAGVSGEVLWKPVDSRLALGVELNYVQQRDFDQLFGLRDYDVMTGHASAYYDFGNGFQGQLDLGRYLAGDYGATVALDREFANGWRVGAYATVTDAETEDFGEGSFDKGIRLTIPMSFVLGTPTRNDNSIALQSLTRDGGARLRVRDRLYEDVRDYHAAEVVESWGRFWR
ncbi:Exopolysaccharide biosynthesis protein YbjH [Poseidonocella pacifica]|uniref:Exopolysaccharide biosynthesis protein YbjH n=1 Tax=Poseidonocella pacifica TaxID=871651 RepID=A0A1I0XVG4_9RHOB|nr:YjbH domain-containing protein [Poseidonocella pacifica]SFB04436.1 Exopolysaccharide biosynthesis protein YbjH [Poseidonocella pacifica]